MFCAPAGHSARYDNFLARMVMRVSPRNGTTNESAVLGSERPSRLTGYELVTNVRIGGFGTVYEGHESATGRRVAIKVARAEVPSSPDQLIREIAVLQALRGASVPALLDSGRLDDGTPYMITEYIDWPTLDQIIAEHPEGMDMARFAEVAEAVIAAIVTAHCHGIRHGDIKPENLLVGRAVDGSWRAVLIDFGLAELAEAATPDETPSTDHDARSADEVSDEWSGETAIGTSAYMSPEQCTGSPSLDLRSDVYSIGVILYELLAGRPPFDGSPAELHRAHLDRRPRPPSRQRAVPDAIEREVLRCLAKSPARRHSDAHTLLETLGPALRGPALRLTDEVRPASAPASVPAWRARGKSWHMVHMFFDADADMGRIKTALHPLGGSIAHVASGQACAVFDSHAGKDLLNRPLHFACSLLEQEMCARVVVDVGPVAVRRRKNGRVRYRSALFARTERYPRPDDPDGLLVSAAVAAVVVDHQMETTPARGDLLHCRVHLGMSAVGSAAHANTLDSGSLSVGREAVLEALVDSARAAFARRTPTAMTVIGEGGYGKSHVCAALCRELAAQRVPPHIIQFRAPEPLGDNPVDALRALVHAALDAPPEVSDDGLRQRLVATIGQEAAAEAWPALAHTLGILESDAPEMKRLTAVPHALRASSVRWLGTVLARFAARGPLCVIIDDAHYADATTLAVLEYCGSSSGDQPIWICALARPSFEQAHPSFGQGYPRVDAMRLEPLARKAAMELCRRLLHPAENVPRRAIESLVERTRGVPLLLVELVHGLQRDGLIRKHERGDMWYLATDEFDHPVDSPLVEWLAERQLRALSEELGNHLRFLALLGRSLSHAEVEGVMAEIARSELADALPLDTEAFVTRLREARILVIDGHGRIDFRHALLRENIAAAVPPAMAAIMHEAAYRYYDTAVDLDDDERLVRLAFHSAQSRREALASTSYLTLAQRAASRHAYLRAERLFSRSLELMPDDAEALERLIALEGRGDMRYRVGRHHDALADLEEARELASAQSSEAEIKVLLEQATVLDWTNEYRRSEALVHRARALAGTRPSPVVAARLAFGRGRSHLRLGRLASARDALGEATRAAERLGDEGYETLVLGLVMSTLVLPMLGDVDEAERVIERLIPLCEQRGDRLHLAAALGNRRVIHIARKRVDLAIEDSLRCIELGRELGIAEFEYACSYNVGELQYLAGDARGAWPHVHRAVELESRRPTGVGRPLAELLRARLLAFEGRQDALRPLVLRLHEQQARAQADGLGEAVFLPTEQLLLDMVTMIARGDDDDERWARLRQQVVTVAVEQETLEVLDMRVRTLARCGRARDAELARAEALELACAVPNIMDARLVDEVAAIPRGDFIDEPDEGAS